MDEASFNNFDQDRSIDKLEEISNDLDYQKKMNSVLISIIDQKHDSIVEEEEVGNNSKNINGNINNV